MSVLRETLSFKYLDINDRRHPERSGRYVPLSAIQLLASELRFEPDGMEQLIAKLRRLGTGARAVDVSAT